MLRYLHGLSSRESLYRNALFFVCYSDNALRVAASILLLYYVFLAEDGSYRPFDGMLPCSREAVTHVDFSTILKSLPSFPDKHMPQQRDVASHEGEQMAIVVVLIKH